MGITITKLKMWKNPGYTRGCVEVPPVGSKKLPAPDYTSLTDLRPRKNATITKLELPLSFIQVFDMSYLYMEAKDSGNNVMKVFGWIDSVEQTASSDEAVVIDWTVDWWRSFSGNVTFGRGNILKCSDSSYKRPYKTEPRKWVVSKFEDLIPKTGSDSVYPFCVVMVYTETDSNQSPPVTSIRYGWWRCTLGQGMDTYTEGGITYKNPRLYDVFNGKIDEILGIDPDAIKGIFVVPYVDWNKSTTNIYKYGTSFIYLKPDISLPTVPMSFTLTDTYESDDLKRAVIMDPTGAIVGVLPWGHKVDSIAGYTDVGTVSAGTHILMKDSTVLNQGPVKVAGEGLAVDVPGIPCPVNSNAYSSYIYSGKRDYDIDMKQIQTNQKAISGGVGAGTNLLGAGLMAMIPGAGALAGFSASAGISQGTQAGSNYLLETFVFNDQLQYAEDQMYSNQSANVLISAGGESCFYINIAVRDWKIVQLEADSVSQTEYSNMVSLNGYDVNIPSSNTSTFISAGGPLQITDLMITGSVPPEAKMMIKGKFEKGVYIVENNPSGVVP